MELKAQSSSRGKSLHFLNLATEIRLQIYSHLVAVGKVFYSPDEFTLANDA
jgi:hypothetical protein